MSDLKLGCVVMAAGNSVRFGDNKLLADFDGKPLIENILNNIPTECFHKIYVISQYDEVIAIAKNKGFNTITNNHPEYGISHTIKLGTKEMLNCDAVIYIVSDQPLLTKNSIKNEIEFYLKNRDNIVAMGNNGKRGNPCIFPKKYFEDLLNLKGDTGGSAVIKNNINDLLIYNIDSYELIDVDTKSDLEKIKNKEELCQHSL